MPGSKTDPELFIVSLLQTHQVSAVSGLVARCLYLVKREHNRAFSQWQAVRDILDRFTVLRFLDNTIYLRAASLNVINGKVGLIFSCDGIHYMKFDEFMDKGSEFWSGGSMML